LVRSLQSSNGLKIAGAVPCGGGRHKRGAARQRQKRRSAQTKTLHYGSSANTATNSPFDAAGAKPPLAFGKLPSSESSVSCRKAPSRWLTLATSQRGKRCKQFFALNESDRFASPGTSKCTGHGHFKVYHPGICKIYYSMFDLFLESLKLFPFIWIISALSRNRSRIAEVAGTSPRMVPQSATGRLVAIIVDAV